MSKGLTGRDIDLSFLRNKGKKIEKSTQEIMDEIDEVNFEKGKLK